MSAVNIKKLFQDWVMPEIQAIKGELKAIDTKIDAKIDSLDTKVDSIRNEILSIRNELLSEIRRVENRMDTAINVHERIAALEVKLGR